jgi:signal transduction histidine kinase
MSDPGYNKSLKNALKNFSKETRDFFFEFLLYNPLPVVVFNKKFEIIFGSREFLRKIKYKSNEFKNSEIPEISPDSYTVIKKAISRLSSGQDKSEIKRVVLRDKNNKNLYGSAALSLFKKKSTELVIMYLLNLDSRAESHLLKDTSKFDEYLYQLTNRGKWILDVDNRLFIGNDICFDLLGLMPKGGIVDFLDVLNLISNREERDAFEKDIIRVNQKPEKIIRELRLKNEDSSNSSTQYIRVIFDRLNNSKNQLIAGSIDDISDFKRIEKDLFRSRSKVEKADRFKSVFLSNLSHEIRTPMNSILGYSELLNQPNLSLEKINEFTAIIRSKGNYLITLIDDVIELARFESGSIQFNYSEFRLVPLLKELHSEFDERRKRNGKTAIKLELDIPEDANNQMIYTDYGRLQQLLSNLLSNALKFTERGKVVFGYKLSSKNFKFFVSDTGVGLTDEDQQKIFNRFEVIEETSINKLSGTGLSLTISKYIVEQLGGKIKVKSEKNKGSRFQLNIPVISPPKINDKVIKEDEFVYSYNWKDKVILIAEDEDVNFKFLEAILQKTQAQILRAKNGQEAIDLCRKINQIDMVLMDIKMPIVNGLDATIEIRRYRSNLPIIAQTDYSSKEEIIKCIKILGLKV